MEKIRYLYDMKSVLYDQDWAKNAANLELYYMHRGIKIKDDLRYDITIIPPKMLGKEFIKTKGHRHQKYQELYIVLKGTAIFLLQKISPIRDNKGKKKAQGKQISNGASNNKIEDAYMVKAKKGEVVIIPPLYDHITINPLKKILKLGNWICPKCKSDYKFIEKKKGACYFYTKKGWVKNKNYKNIPKLRSEKPLKSIPKNLDFLN